MKPSYRDAADDSDMNYEISELRETNKGWKIDVTSKPKKSKTTTAPVFYDSSNDENLFFTLPDLNFSDYDSNSEDDATTAEKGTLVADAVTESPAKSDIDFTPGGEVGLSDIKNFSVMKRYLRKEKKNNIIIELNEVDAAGVVLKTQIVQADEFSVSTSAENATKTPMDDAA